MIKGISEEGLKYAVRRSQSSVAYCALGVRYRIDKEDNFHEGIAHFTEHTIFKGTKHKSAKVINNYLDKLGGELNAFTSKEEIVLHSTVLKEDARKAASLLFEIALTPIFPKKEIEKEKSVVIDEINVYKDSPADYAYDCFEETLFEGSHLGSAILGTKESVKAITTEELKKFSAEKFIANNMAFCIVADEEESKLEKMILRLSKKWFSEKETISNNAPIVSNDIKSVKDGNEITIGKFFNQTIDQGNHEANAVIGAVAPSIYNKKKRFATVLMSNILGGPASNSILNNELREKNGWVYNAECSYTQYSETGIVAISLGCDNDNLNKCLREVRKAIRKLQTKVLSERALKSCKKQLLGQLAISSDNGETQCLSMVKNLLFFGEITSKEEIRNNIDNITAEEVKQMALEIFKKDQMSSLIVK